VLAQEVIQEQGDGEDAGGLASEGGGAEAVLEEALVDGGARVGASCVVLFRGVFLEF